MALCLSAGSASIKLAVSAFSLIWLHSIEKIDWQEDWQVSSDTLTLASAWVKGSGAGMEIPDGAVHEGGRWRYHPRLQVAQLSLVRSAYSPDYRLCLPGQPCRPLADWLPAAATPTEIRACREEDAAR